jgi:hypothetical protein
MDFKTLIAQITRDHPDWTAEEIKAELYHRLVESSPAFLDDSHVKPEVVASQSQER